VGKAYDTITFKSAKCDGCGDCLQACATAKTRDDIPGQPRLSIVPGAGGTGFELAMCRQCAQPKCAMNCPAGALGKTAGTGVVGWNADKCVGCLLCTVGCSYAGIVVDVVVGKAMAKCDQCGGDPACVAACKPGALSYDTASHIYKKWGGLEDLFAPGLSACQGCNSELLIRHTLRRVGPETVVATPPGCIAGMGAVGYNGQTGTKVPVFHPLLTNTAAMLTGVRRYYNRIGRDVTALALAGDGGVVDVGFQSLSGAAERGEQMLFICVDNEGYMNTGMQRSGSTSYGSWTSTTPVGAKKKGKSRDSKNMPLLMMMHQCEYVATASLGFMDDYYEKLEKAIEASRRGMAYLHVYSPCPTGWRFPAAITTESCRKGVETNFVALWEYTPDDGLRFTRPVDNPLPIEEYLKLFGKYRHLTQEQIEHIRESVNRQIRQLKIYATNA